MPKLLTRQPVTPTFVISGLRAGCRAEWGPSRRGLHITPTTRTLKLWVLATLIDSTLLVYDLFIAPLSPTDRQAYYEDSRLLARLLGIPPSMMPATYADFNTYTSSMLAGDTLTVGDTAHELAEALFAPPLMGRLARAVSFVSIGLLPDQLRRAYHFTWDEEREKRLHWLAGISRRVRPLVPSILCVSPRALMAEWHICQ